MATWTYQWTTTGEVVGSGNGSNLGPFTHTCTNLPLVANTTSGQVSIYVGGVLVGTDNGSGTIVGANLTGSTVNYTTGAISVTFTSGHAPANGTNNITVNYATSTINIPVGTVANFDWCVWTLKNVMVNAGWTVQYSGDGTTYYSSSDGITKGTTGAHGISNNYAWFVIRSPDSAHYLCFQRGSSGAGYWSICVSKTGFTGTANGSPSGTVAPTASDQYGVYGTTGQTTSISYSNWFSSATLGSFHWNCAADSSSPYGVWASSFPQNTNTYGSAGNGMLIDSLASGSYQAADPDPWVIYVSDSTSYWCAGNGAGNYCVSSQNGTLTNYCSFVAWPLRISSGSATTNIYTGKDDALPVFWYFTGSAHGGANLKGQSNYFYVDTFYNRVTASTLDVTTISDHIVINDWVFPWLSGASVLIG